MNDQRSVKEQLDDLIRLAHKDGLYDASDWIIRHIEEDKKKIESIKHSIKEYLKTLK